MTVGNRGALEALFEPRNLVMVGVSDRAGHWGPRVWSNVKRLGYRGKVFLVHPTRKELWGERCYARLDDLPEGPDHLAIFTPADVTLDVLEQGGRLGARAATLYAAGFGEGGDEEGRARAVRLKEVLARTGIKAAGPNCMGIAGGRSKLVTLPDETLHEPKPGPVAIITQSGTLATSFSRAMNGRGLACGYIVSCGNQVGLTIADYIDHMADDPDLRVIVCYIEALKDAPRFLAAAAKARANGKAIVTVKIGGTEAARGAALAHTGSLVGNVQAFDAYAREAGIIRLDVLEHTIEAAEYLSHAARPKRPGVAFVTNSGALTTLMTEAAERDGVVLSALSDETKARLLKVLGTAEKLGNPLDTIRTIPTDQFIGCVDVLCRAPEAGLVVVLEELPQEAGVVRKEANFRALEAFAREQAAAGGSVAPVAVLSQLPFADTTASLALRAELAHLPMMRGLGASFATLAAMGRARGAEGDASIPELVRARAAQWLERAARLSGPTPLDEVESKRLLAAYGIRLPQESLVANAEDAVTAAERIGYPVVMKAVSADVPHKSDAGLVLLRLENAAGVRAAAATIAARCSAIGARLEGLLVAQYVTGGTEMVAGVTRDPEMGHVVIAGAGGVLLELIKDVAFATPRLERAAALAVIAETRSSRLLQGYRGKAPGDVVALADAMVALGAMARELGSVLHSVDVNPLLVLDAGQGAVALDGLVVLNPPEAATSR